MRDPRCGLFIVRDIVTAPGSPWSAVQRLVALAVADHMNAAGECFPSARRLAGWTGMHRATVLRILGELCGDGPLALFDQTPGGSPAGGSRASNTYRLKAGLPVAQGDQSQRATGRGGQHDRSRTATALVAQGDTTGRARRHRRGHEGTIEGTSEGAEQLAAEHLAWLDRERASDETDGDAIVRWYALRGIPFGTPLQVAISTEVNRLRRGRVQVSA